VFKELETDLKFSTVCEKKCQKTAGRRRGIDFLTHTVEWSR